MVNAPLSAERPVLPVDGKTARRSHDRKHGLGTKHIIFISDGDHWNANPALLRKIRDAKITCTTICITTHGQDEVKKMKAVAEAMNLRTR